MLEIELKYGVPPESGPALRRAVATASSEVVPMRATYFDTPDRALAQAAIGLRLRREGRRWVQTLKAGGVGLLGRLEHEIALPFRAAATPPLELHLHLTHPAGERLAQALGVALADLPAAAGRLQPWYTTDLLRTRRAVRVPGAVVEVSLDEGEITAQGRRLAVFELEMELLRGSVAGLADLARRWTTRHGLWLDPATKAERGDRLARGATAPAVVRAKALRLGGDESPRSALQAIVQNGLAQALPNAAAVAGDQTQPEHLHQWRVALRRLRTALKLYRALPGDDPALPTPDAMVRWETELADVFRGTGGARDAEALDQSLLPRLQPLGIGALRFGGLPVPALQADMSPADLARSRGCNLLMLELLVWSHAESPPPSPSVDGTPKVAREAGRNAQTGELRTAMLKPLRKVHRQCMKLAERWDDLPDEERHGLRKRLKRLRYGLEFAGGVIKPKALKQALAGLKPAQTALGEYNDLHVAITLLQAPAENDVHAAKALGWLMAEQAHQATRCQQRLIEAMKAPMPW